MPQVPIPLTQSEQAPTASNLAAGLLICIRAQLVLTPPPPSNLLPMEQQQQIWDYTTLPISPNSIHALP